MILFRVVPKCFSFVHSIRLIIVPLVYVLSFNKTEETYCRMSEALNSIKCNLDPKLLDFEVTVMNASQLIYPNG